MEKRTPRERLIWIATLTAMAIAAYFLYNYA